MCVCGLFFSTHQFVVDWSETTGCIDVTPCPGVGQIVCINAEVGRLYPLRLRSGQEETVETESRWQEWTFMRR